MIPIIAIALAFDKHTLYAKNYMRQRIEILCVVLFLVTLGLSGTIIPCASKPVNRICAGMHGYSPDYIQYVSYIKEGMYGRYHMLFRSFPPEQPSTPIHWEYILPGIIAGPFGVEATLVYHLLRAVLGGIVVILTYRFFRLAFRSHTIAILSTLVAFVSSSFGWGTHMYNYLPFFMSTPQRVTDRPHYLMGGILFLFVLERLWRGRATTGNLLLLLVASGITVMVHLSSGIILAGVAAGFIGVSLVTNKSNRFRHPDITKAASVIAGCGIGAYIIYEYVKVYARVSDIFVDKFIYSAPLTTSVVIRELLSFGPTLVIGLPGLLIGLLVVRDTTWRQRIIIAFWALLHITLFFVFYRYLHIDRIRFVQSLYYIPLAYGTVWTIRTLSHRISKHIFPLGIALVLLMSLPTYIVHLQQDIGATTDYTDFSLFAFPTTNQYAAYKYLDSSAPRESTVLAKYETSNLLLMYSHNRTLGNDQGWTPEGGSAMKQEVTQWFTGTLPPDTARAYLDRYHVTYVYYGYQERIGKDIATYPFLENVYSNPEVTIFRVRDQ